MRMKQYPGKPFTRAAGDRLTASRGTANIVQTGASGENPGFVTKMAAVGEAKAVGFGTLLVEQALDLRGPSIDFSKLKMRAMPNLASLIGSGTASTGALLLGGSATEGRTVAIQWDGNVANNTTPFNAIDIVDDQNSLSRYVAVCLEHNGDFLRVIGDTEKKPIEVHGRKITNGYAIRAITLNAGVSTPDELRFWVYTDTLNQVYQDYEGLQSSITLELDLEGTTSATYLTGVNEACFDIRGSKTTIISGVARGLTQRADVSQAFTATTSNVTNPTVLTAVSSFTNLAVGMPISGAGISSVAKIIALDPTAGTVTMSAVASASASGVSITAKSQQAILRSERSGVQPRTGEVVSGSTAGGGELVFRHVVFVQETGTVLNLVNPGSVTGQVLIRKNSRATGAAAGDACVIIQSTTASATPEGACMLDLTFDEVLNDYGLQLGNDNAINNTGKKTLLAANIRLAGRILSISRTALRFNNAQDCVVDAIALRDGKIQFDTNALRNTVIVTPQWVLNGGGITTGGTSNRVYIKGSMTAAQLPAGYPTGSVCESVSDKAGRPAYYDGAAWTYVQYGA